MAKKTTKVICLLAAGEVYKLSAADQEWCFEMHPYMGPCTVSPKLFIPDPPTKASRHFWDAYERWNLGGRVFTGNREPLQCYCAAMVCKVSG